MAKRIEAKKLTTIRKAESKVPVIGVFSPCDPRIDRDSRKRAQNVISLVADTISPNVVLPDKTPAGVVYSDILIDSESQADIVAHVLRHAILFLHLTDKSNTFT